MNTIYYWADGTWCYKHEYNWAEYSWKSDDFGKLEVSDEASYEEIDLMVCEKVS